MRTALSAAMNQIPLPLFSQDDDEADDPTLDAENAVWGSRRRTVDARYAEPLAPGAPASIWAMAKAASDALRKGGRFGAAAGFKASAPLFKGRPVVTPAAPGVTKVQGSRYPANRWTDERAEQEKARRARQKPPKPVRGARTRGKKLLDLIGPNED
jgi:hypothetical protein